jgi:hypothetical protein
MNTCFGRRAVLWAFATMAGLSGCAPVFSDLQSARLVGRDHVEVTAGASRVTIANEEFDDEDDNHVLDHFGVQAATGIAKGVDARLRYERVELNGDEGGFNVVAFGPKVQIVKDRVAAYVPVGFAFGGDVEAGDTWQVHPTLLLTLPAQRNVELNASAKWLVPLTGEVKDKMVAFNFGLGLGQLDRWAIRPEIGFLLNPGSEGHFTQFSLGLSYRPR